MKRKVLYLPCPNKLPSWFSILNLCTCSNVNKVYPTCTESWKGDRLKLVVFTQLQDLPHGAGDGGLLGLSHHVDDVLRGEVARSGDDDAIAGLGSFMGSEKEQTCFKDAVPQF